MMSTTYRLMWPHRLALWAALAVGALVAFLACVNAAMFLLAFAAFWAIRANPVLSFVLPRISEVTLACVVKMSVLGFLIVLSHMTSAFLVIYNTLAVPFEITVDPANKSIQVRSMLRTIRVPAADVRRVTIGGFLDFSMSRLVVRHAGGKIACINRFRHGDALIDDVQALGPSIEIERIWGLRGL